MRTSERIQPPGGLAGRAKFRYPAGGRPEADSRQKQSTKIIDFQAVVVGDLLLQKVFIFILQKQRIAVPIRGGGRNSARIDERQGKPLGAEERRRTDMRTTSKKEATRHAHSLCTIPAAHMSLLQSPPPPYQKTRTSCTVAHMEADLGRPRPSIIAAEAILTSNGKKALSAAARAIGKSLRPF